MQANREASTSIQLYRKNNLSDLVFKMMTYYIHNTLLTELVKKEVTTNVEFMKRYYSTKLCDTTVLKRIHIFDHGVVREIMEEEGIN